MNVQEPFDYQRTFSQYGLNDKLAAQFQVMFEKFYGVNFSISELQEFTFEKLQSFKPISAFTKDSYFCNDKYNYLMPKFSIEKLNEFESSNKFYPLFVIHPIEGHTNMLKSWAKYMKYPVYGIQYTSEALKYDSIEKLAEFYLKQIDSEFGPESHFHLAGYSFGGTVAFELASKYANRIQSLTFFDGSYKYFNPSSYSFGSKFNDYSSSTREADFIYSFIAQYAPFPVGNKFIEELKSLDSFDSRVNYSVQYLMKSSNFNFYPEDIQQAVRSYVKRMIISDKYEPSLSLSFKEVILVKPSQSNAFSEKFGKDYGLNAVTRGKVFIHAIDCDALSFWEPANAYKIATFLNEYLPTFSF